MPPAPASFSNIDRTLYPTLCGRVEELVVAALAEEVAVVVVPSFWPLDLVGRRVALGSRDSTEGRIPIENANIG